MTKIVIPVKNDNAVKEISLNGIPGKMALIKKPGKSKGRKRRLKSTSPAIT
jgi:hypothetical protein